MTVTAPTARHVPEQLPDRIQHYIDGEFVDSLGGETFDVLDPVSNEPYTTAAAGQIEDVELAVAAARRAFPDGPWPRMKARERTRVLNRIADAVEAQEARLAELETFDTGLPITQARGQALRAAENFRFFADLIVAQADDALPGARLPDQLRQPQAGRRRRASSRRGTPRSCSSPGSSPRPWPPAARSCSSRPSSRPLSASLWAGIFESAGLPDGVFNLVDGLGETAGDALVKHPDVPSSRSPARRRPGS